MSDDQAPGDEPADSDAEQALDDGDELDEREREALNAAISRSLDQEARGEVSPVSEILARLRARRRDEAQGYDRAMSEGQAAKQLEPEAPSADRLPPETEDAYRARVIAKIERGIADVKAGRVVPHAEVMARFEARYGSKK